MILGDAILGRLGFRKRLQEDVHGSLGFWKRLQEDVHGRLGFRKAIEVAEVPGPGPALDKD